MTTYRFMRAHPRPQTTTDRVLHWLTCGCPQGNLFAPVPRVRRRQQWRAAWRRPA